MILVVADDISGAAEIAATGRTFGLTVQLQMKPAAGSSAELVVIDTDTRYKSIDPRRDIENALINYDTTLVEWYYKKVDSVLRGNISTELCAMMQILKKNRTILAPANPTKARVISDGQYFIDGRPLPKIMRQPQFLAAVSASMIAYGVMSLLMTATPLAMIGCGYADVQAGTVIQWHVVGMFAPSFITGHLITRFGLRNVMMAGAGMLVLCLIVSMNGIEFVNFWSGLFLLGVGWNFLFVGATTMLTTVHTPAERA